MKVLLVDDSRTTRTIQKGILSQLGYHDISEACDGLDAMSKALADKPDLILLDWNMPNMNGLEFIKKFRPMNNEATVIMVTTEAEKSRVLEAVKAGVNNYAVKPFTPEGLKERIQETLAKKATVAA